MNKKYFDILNLNENASIQEVKDSYKTLINFYNSKLNEDNSNFDEINKKILEINSAYDYLNAEWNYLIGQIYYKEGWYDKSKTHFEIAYNLEPNNFEYAQSYNSFVNSNNEFRKTYTKRAGFDNNGCGCCGGGCCDTCCTLLCLDSCCELCGCDLISCC